MKKSNKSLTEALGVLYSGLYTTNYLFVHIMIWSVYKVKDMCYVNHDTNN